MGNIFNIVLIVLGVIQIIMIVKFFEIADDIKNIRRSFDLFLKGKQVEKTDETLTEKAIVGKVSDKKIKKTRLNLLGNHGLF